MITNSAREEILSKVRWALGRQSVVAAGPLPASAQVEPRQAGDADSEIELLMTEIGKLGGVPRRLPSAQALHTALRELVVAEAIGKAMVWETPELEKLGVADSLRDLGVEIVPAHAAPERLAECELGVTGVDAALPETGTLLLRSAPDKPRAVSLLPRVHLALLRSEALRADLPQALADIKSDGYAVCITGPSRTSDIELTVTIGVHGPKSLYAWLVEV